MCFGEGENEVFVCLFEGEIEVFVCVFWVRRLNYLHVCWGGGGGIEIFVCVLGWGD